MTEFSFSAWHEKMGQFFSYLVAIRATNYAALAEASGILVDIG